MGGLCTAPVICWRSVWRWGAAGQHRISDRLVSHHLGLVPSFFCSFWRPCARHLHLSAVQVWGRWRLQEVWIVFFQTCNKTHSARLAVVDYVTFVYEYIYFKSNNDWITHSEFGSGLQFINLWLKQVKGKKNTCRKGGLNVYLILKKLFHDSLLCLIFILNCNCIWRLLAQEVIFLFCTYIASNVCIKQPLYFKSFLSYFILYICYINILLFCSQGTGVPTVGFVPTAYYVNK